MFLTVIPPWAEFLNVTRDGHVIAIQIASRYLNEKTAFIGYTTGMERNIVIKLPEITDGKTRFIAGNMEIFAIDGRPYKELEFTKFLLR